MAHQYETGHAKNVALLFELIEFCSGYGASYNPANPAITISALGTLHTNAVAALGAVNDAMPPYTIAVDNRENAFAPLAKLITKVQNAVNASALPKNIKDDVKTITRKLQGQRATPKKTAEDGTPAKTHSVSQLSYDQRIENFDKLIHLLASVPSYAPNETDVTVAGLNPILAQLRVVNAAAVSAAIPLSNARIARNTTLYNEQAGIPVVGADVKSYIKSIFGGTSPQYKQVAALKFKVVKF